MRKEIYERELWNKSMSKTLRGCSSAASQFIRARIERNRGRIDEINSMRRELDLPVV